MKTKIFILIILCATCKLYAQEPADALRYSWLTQGGTARNQAIGGAGASLGGEFSSLFINPAGLGFNKNYEFVLTPAYSMQKSKDAYKGNTLNNSKDNFILGATGLLFAVPANNRNEKNYTFAFGVNKIADFNSNIYYKGVNNKSSYSEKYLEELINNNATDPNSAANNFPYSASLAFNTFLIDTTTVNGNFGYKTLANPATGLIQENTINSSGGVYDIAFGGAVNLKDKLFFGGSLTIPILNYKRNSSFKESDATANTTNNFNYFQVNEYLKTSGYGISAKLGVIYKPQEYVRLGLAVDLPTFYQLKDSYTAEVVTDLEGYGGAGIKKQNSGQFNNGEAGLSKYYLTTPWRIIASGSYVFREVADTKKQRGFITADIEYINYKASNFEAFNTDDGDAVNYYHDLNKVIDQQYKGNFNFRLGGELKFNTIMFRLGGAYYGNPYKNDKGSIAKLSGGLGYRDKGMFIDLTYVYSMNKDVSYPYRLEAKENDPALIKNNLGNVVATIGFKL